MTSSSFSLVLLFVTFSVSFCSFYDIGVTVCTQQFPPPYTLSHVTWCQVYHSLFLSLSVCLFWCNFVILQGRSAAGGIMLYLFVFWHDSNHINISIFHQVLAVQSPFSLFNALCITVFDCSLDFPANDLYWTLGK